MKRVAPTDTQHAHPVPHPNLRNAELEERVEAVAVPHFDPPQEVADRIAFYLCSKHLKPLSCVNSIWYQWIMEHTGQRVQKRCAEIQELMSFLIQVHQNTGNKGTVKAAQLCLQVTPLINSLRFLTHSTTMRFQVCNKIINAIGAHMRSVPHQSYDHFLNGAHPKVQRAIQEYLLLLSTRPQIITRLQLEAEAQPNAVLSRLLEKLDWKELDARYITPVVTLAEKTTNVDYSVRVVACRLAQSEIGTAPIYQAVTQEIAWQNFLTKDHFLDAFCLNWPHKSLPELMQELSPFLAQVGSADILYSILGNLFERYPALTPEEILGLITEDTELVVKDTLLRHVCTRKAKIPDFDSAFAILSQIQSPSVFERTVLLILFEACACKAVKHVVQAAQLLPPEHPSRNAELMYFCGGLIDERYPLESIESVLLLIESHSRVRWVEDRLRECSISLPQTDPSN